MTFLSSLVERASAILRESLIGWPTPISLRPALFVGVSVCLSTGLFAQETANLDPFAYTVKHEGGESENIHLAVEATATLEEAMGLAARVGADPKYKDYEIILYNMTEEETLPQIAKDPRFEQVRINLGAQMVAYENYMKDQNPADGALIDHAIAHDQQMKSDLRRYKGTVVPIKMIAYGVIHFFIVSTVTAHVVIPLLTAMALTGVYLWYVDEIRNDSRKITDVAFRTERAKKFGLDKMAIPEDGFASDFYTLKQKNIKKFGNNFVGNYFTCIIYYGLYMGGLIVNWAIYEPDRLANFLAKTSEHGLSRGTLAFALSGLTLSLLTSPKEWSWAKKLRAGFLWGAVGAAIPVAGPAVLIPAYMDNISDTMPAFGVRRVLEEKRGLTGITLKKQWIFYTAITSTVLTSLVFGSSIAHSSLCGAIIVFTTTIGTVYYNLWDLIPAKHMTLFTNALAARYAQLKALVDPWNKRFADFYEGQMGSSPRETAESFKQTRRQLWEDFFGKAPEPVAPPTPTAKKLVILVGAIPEDGLAAGIKKDWGHLFKLHGCAQALAR